MKKKIENINNQFKKGNRLILIVASDFIQDLKMQINTYFILCFLSFTIGCKIDKSKQQQKITQADTLKVGSQKEIKSEVNDIDSFIKESIVISCGSGCALSYSPEKITRRGNDLVVEFKVLMYEDELIKDTYEQTFIFSYDNLNGLEKIAKDGEVEDFFESQMPNTRKSFKSFGENLIKSDKVKISKNDFLNPNSNFPIIDKKIAIDSTDTTSVYKLADNVYLSWFDEDSERWYVSTYSNNELIDQRLMGKSETIETATGTTDYYIDFTIDKGLNIVLEYSKGKGFASRKIFKTEKYFINKQNLKVESNN